MASATGDRPLTPPPLSDQWPVSNRRNSENNDDLCKIDPSTFIDCPAQRIVIDWHGQRTLCATCDDACGATGGGGVCGAHTLTCKQWSGDWPTELLLVDTGLSDRCRSYSRRQSNGVRYYADRGLQTIAAAAIAIDFPTRITNRYRFAGLLKNQRILPQI